MSAVPAAVREISPPTCRVLVVDDQPQAHAEVRRILNGRHEERLSPEMQLFRQPGALLTRERPSPVSFDIDVAYQGQEAVSRAAAARAVGRPYDLAIIDMHMPPGMDGLDTVAKLWAAQPELQVVLCSTQSPHDFARISQRLGVSDRLWILHKPFGADELLQLAHGAAVRANREALQRSGRVSVLALDASRLLLSRADFERRLRGRLEDERSPICCLLQVEIDRFAALADRLGADAALAVVHTTAQMVRGRLGNSLLARGRDDAFLVLLPDVRLPAAVSLAQEVCRDVRKANVQWHGELLRASVSIGVLEMEPRMLSGPDALCAADTACAEARGSGGNAVRAYRWNDAVVVRSAREVSELPQLQRAIDDERFVLYFQPIRNLARHDAPLAGEVLVRMVDDQGTLRMPGTFLPAAERFGLIAAIDRCVLRGVLDWMDANPTAASRMDYLSINLSGQTLCDAECRDHIERMVSARSGHAARLCFEITETAVIHNLAPVRGFLESLAKLGCRFALDDFGTGFSSLRYLHCLPVHLVKIDGAFVRTCHADAGVRRMLVAINELCHTLGKQTVAEFAEQPATLAVLREVGVDHAQGFAIARPFALTDLEARPAPDWIPHEAEALRA